MTTPEGTGTQPMVIVGGGETGGQAAATLRDEGFTGPVVLIGRDRHPLGLPRHQGDLRSEQGLGGPECRAATRYEGDEVDLRADSVAAIVPRRTRRPWRRARNWGIRRFCSRPEARTGGCAYPALSSPGVHYLRTVAECDAIKGAARAGQRAVVVGMGFIGCEVAASLTQLGVDVTVIYPGTNPLERVLGDQVGALIGSIHRSKGVRLLAGGQVTAFAGTQRVESVVMADGNQVDCDFAVVAVGIAPDVPDVASSAMAQDNGILVDELCRTSAADVYAAGDVANHLHPVLGRIRVEHYNSAQHHGAAAARSMMGSTAPFDYIHNFWSDQYEHTLQYVGHATRWDNFAVRGNLAEGKFLGFYLLEGVIRAAIGFDRGGDPEYEQDSEMAACARLVAVRARPDPGALADEHADLSALG